MVIDFLHPIQSLKDVDDITEILEVQFPHAVTCEINLDERKARIPRFELKLKGNRPIAAGWTAQIAIVQDINRRYTLRDAIVLPMIAPSKKGFAVEGGTADIPGDIAGSHDEWALEWYITDPYQESVLLFRSEAVSFKNEDEDAQASADVKDELRIKADELDIEGEVDLTNQSIGSEAARPDSRHAHTSAEFKRVKAKKFSVTNVKRND